MLDQHIPDRHTRLFELIRQENLMDDRRRRPSDDPMRLTQSQALLRAASKSLRPVSDLAQSRKFLI